MLTQCILIHQRTQYFLILDFDMKAILDALIVVALFTIGVLNLIRLNTYIPESYKGEYQLIAQRVLDRNQEELQINNQQLDIIYENKVCDEEFNEFEYQQLLIGEDPPG